MSMMKPATRKAAFAKVGLFGTAGAGKTYTAAKIAIGLHQYAKLEKPVGMFDTEPAASFILPLFEKAGVPFVVYDESRALADLIRFTKEAEQECSIAIVDSITHVWRDAQASYLARINQNRTKKITKLEFHHWGPIKAAWAGFTDLFLASRLHIIICGRAGQIYEYQKNDETGKLELITTGARMATEKELGYEPSLLIELSPERVDGKIVNTAFVEKDRADKLNGHTIERPDFEKLRPHFEFLNIGGEHAAVSQRDSREMFTEDGTENFQAELRQRTIYCEEVQALMVEMHPGQTAADKQAKAKLLKDIFGTGSWTAVENMPSEKIRAGFDAMKELLGSVRQAQGDEQAPHTGAGRAAA
jgi:hypothetical protein